MRVPSIGLTVEERRISRQGLRFAAHLLRGYQDKPGIVETIRQGLRQLQLMVAR